MQGAQKRYNLRRLGGELFCPQSSNSDGATDLKTYLSENVFTFLRSRLFKGIGSAIYILHFLVFSSRFVRAYMPTTILWVRPPLIVQITHGCSSVMKIYPLSFLKMIMVTWLVGFQFSNCPGYFYLTLHFAWTPIYFKSNDCIYVQAYKT